MKQLLKILLFSCLSIFTLNSCTEPYQLQSETFEDLLVVEATITNELKKQEVKISHTYPLETSEPQPETGATVFIKDSNGNLINFIEQNGIYVSETAFEALPNTQYQLFIKTQEGKEYRSTNQTLTTANTISIDTDVVEKDSKRGVQISVNSFDPTNSSKYYRFDYSETYKVIAPKHGDFKAIIIGPTQGQIGMYPRGYESKTCYSTVHSKSIFLYNTTDLSEDLVSKFPIRFIEDQDYIISERYSILVKQFVLSQDAYNYYKAIKDLSDSGQVLSPNQPGFVIGNIKSLTNPKEKIIGFFNVSSMSEQRIFFNYEDIFPNELRPEFFMDCPEETLDPLDKRTNPIGDFYKLRDYIITGTKVLYKVDFNPNPNNPKYIMVPAPCGDCTTFSSNVIPPFWQ